MLVLSRKRSECIIIGEGANQVKIMVVSIQGDRVRLGIEADPSIPIHRLEVHRSIQRERGEAE
jgi:carbon storage regulator